MSTNLGKTKREEVLRKLTEKAFPPEKFAVAAKPFLDALMASPAMEVPLMLSRDYPEYVCKRESIRMDFPEVRMPWDWASSFFNRTTVHVPLPKTVAVNFKRDGYVMLEEKDGEYAARYSPSSKEGLPALSDPVMENSIIAVYTILKQERDFAKELQVELEKIKTVEKLISVFPAAAEYFEDKKAADTLEKARKGLSG